MGMEPTESELIAYIRSETGLGVAPEVIRQKLLGAGWAPEHVAEAFTALRTEPQSPHAPTADTSGGTKLPAKRILVVLGVVIALSLLTAAVYALSLTKESPLPEAPGGADVSAEDAEENVPTGFNTQATMLLDLSSYDVEGTKRLLSEVGYFTFDGKGYMATLPLIKKDGGEILVAGLPGKMRELDGFGIAVGDGNYFAYMEQSTSSTKVRYVIEEIETGKKILETLYIDRLIAMLVSGTGKTVLLGEDDGYVSWSYDNKHFSVPIPQGNASLGKDEWINLVFYRDERHIAFPVINGDKSEVLVSSPEGYREFYPKWKYNDPIAFIRVLNVRENGTVLYLAFGEETAAFFENEEEIAGGIDVATAEFLLPFLDNETTPPLYRISENGEQIAVVDGSHFYGSTGNESVRVFGREPKTYPVQPAGARITSLRLSDDGKHLAYISEHDSGKGWNGKTAYVVIDGQPAGPWDSVKRFTWLHDGGYVYWASDDAGNDVIVKNGKILVSLPEYPEDKTAFFIIEDSVWVSEETGDIVYVLGRNVSGGLNVDWESKVVVNGSESRVYNGLATGMIRNRDLFSPDGTHVVYLVSGEKRIVIDGKEYVLNGTLLDAWVGPIGAFSEDGNWFGTYVMKENQVWWIPYELK